MLALRVLFPFGGISSVSVGLSAGQLGFGPALAIGNRPGRVLPRLRGLSDSRSPPGPPVPAPRPWGPRLFPAGSAHLGNPIPRRAFRVLWNILTRMVHPEDGIRRQILITATDERRGVWISALDPSHISNSYRTRRSALQNQSLTKFTLCPPAFLVVLTCGQPGTVIRNKFRRKGNASTRAREDWKCLPFLGLHRPLIRLPLVV